MSQSTQKIWWGTTPQYLVPLCIIVVLAAFLLTMSFLGKGMINEAFLVSLGAVVLLLVFLINLLADLVMIGRRIEKSLESKSQ